MAQQITNTLSEINILYNRKQNIEKLLDMINGSTKQVNEETIKQLMKKLPTFEQLCLIIDKITFLISATKNNYKQKIDEFYNIDKLTICDKKLHDNKYPYKKFLDNLREDINIKKFLDNNHRIPEIAAKFEKMGEYLNHLDNSIKIFCNLNENYNINNLYEYNMLINNMIDSVCSIMLSPRKKYGDNAPKYRYYNYTYSNTTRTLDKITNRYIYDTLQFTANELIITNWDSNAKKNTTMISKIILNTIDLPIGYKKIINDVPIVEYNLKEDFSARTYYLLDMKKLPKINSTILIINSRIDIEMEKEENKDAFFVLFSNLNGTCNIKHQNFSNISDFDWYIEKNGFIPEYIRGQLALHNEICQFILDYAANIFNPDGINYVKYLLNSLETNMDDIKLTNGVLQIPEKNTQSDLFLDNLHMILVFGIENAPVKGKYYGRKNVENGKIEDGKIDKIHNVNATYASTVSIYGNNSYYINENLINITNYVMIGQYYGALNNAYKKYKDEKIKIFLMPLYYDDGFSHKNMLSSQKEYFEDIHHNIFCCIIIAIKLLEEKHPDANEKLTINILTWNEYESNLTETLFKKFKEQYDSM